MFQFISTLGWKGNQNYRLSGQLKHFLPNKFMTISSTIVLIGDIITKYMLIECQSRVN